MSFNYSEFNINLSNDIATFYDLDSAKTKVRKFALTRQDLHQALSMFEYSNCYKDTAKLDHVEKLKAMPFSYHFYYMTVKNGLPPSPREYVDSYINTYVDHWTSKNGCHVGHFKQEFLPYTSYKTFEIKGLEGRLLRAYNSYNRELDLFLYMRDEMANRGYKVEYDLNIDRSEGIDLLVTRDDFKIGVASFVDSNSAVAYKSIKDSRYNDTRTLDVQVVNFKATLWGVNQNVEPHGEVMLYNDQALKKLRKEIVSEFKKSKQIEKNPAIYNKDISSVGLSI